jgi:hypothetical protein
VEGEIRKLIVSLQLEFDAKSEIAKLGIFQNGQVGYFFDATASCHLIMRQH